MSTEKGMIVGSKKRWGQNVPLLPDGHRPMRYLEGAPRQWIVSSSQHLRQSFCITTLRVFGTLRG